MSVYSHLLSSRGVFPTLIGCEVVGMMVRVSGVHFQTHWQYVQIVDWSVLSVT